MIISERRKRLFEIGNLIAQNSGGRAILCQEVAKSGINHFIKVDGRKIGYHLEYYGSIGDETFGWEQTLPIFLAEVLKPLKFLGLLISYNVAGEQLKRLGHEIYAEEVYSQWEALF